MPRAVVGVRGHAIDSANRSRPSTTVTPSGSRGRGRQRRARSGPCIIGDLRGSPARGRPHLGAALLRRGLLPLLGGAAASGPASSSSAQVDGVLQRSGMIGGASWATRTWSRRGQRCDPRQRAVVVSPLALADARSPCRRVSRSRARGAGISSISGATARRVLGLLPFAACASALEGAGHQRGVVPGRGEQSANDSHDVCSPAQGWRAAGARQRRA